MTAPYVVVVEFVLHSADLMSAFRPLMDENARTSCRLEPGCRRFDVLVSRTRADTILLYEIYDSRAEFEAHLIAPHYVSFDQATAGMVRSKVVQDFTLDCEGSQPETP